MSAIPPAAPRPPSPGSLAHDAILCGVVLFFCLIIDPQLAWLFVVAWLPIYLWWKWRRRLLAACLLPLCGAIIVAHGLGYRVYGPEFVVEREPAAGDDVVVAFGPDNLVTLADGRSFQLAGLRLIPGMTLSRHALVQGLPEPPQPEASERAPFTWKELAIGLANGNVASRLLGAYQLALPPTGLRARVEPLAAGRARIEVVFRYHREPGCLGNSFRDERLFPPRIDHHQSLDLAMALLGCPFLEPDDTDEGKRYRAWMTAHRAESRR